jgi:hypothetical protein
MCLWVSYKKKLFSASFGSLKSLKKGVRSDVGSGSISQRYGSGYSDPDPHQNVTDPRHWFGFRPLAVTPSDEYLYLAGDGEPVPQPERAGGQPPGQK